MHWSTEAVKILNPKYTSHIIEHYQLVPAYTKCTV